MKFKKTMLATAILFSVALSAQAAPVSFVFNYTDAAGTGFNDAALGQQRKDALQLASLYWGTLLQASYAGETINLGVDFLASSTATNPLNAASAAGVYANGQMDNKGLQNVVYTAPLAEHLAGRNLNGSAMDYTLSFNANVPTYLGLDGNPQAGEYDFFSYSLRAIARTLGFNTRVDASATATQGTFFSQFNTATGTNMSMPGIYDTFLATSSGTTWASMTAAQRIAADTTGTLYWTGANAVALHGGVPLQVNAMPLTSTGRLDGNAIIYLAPSNTTLMTYNGILPGQTMGLDAQTAGMVVDMGWTLSVPLPVPEPSTYAMLLAGLGFMGFTARRRLS